MHGLASSVGSSVVGTVDLFLSCVPLPQKLCFMLSTSPSLGPFDRQVPGPYYEVTWRGAILHLPGRVALSCLDE